MPCLPTRRRVASAALGLAGLAYPFLVLAGLRHLPAGALLLLPVLLLAARLALGRRGPTEIVLAGAALAVLALHWLAPALALRAWPVLVSLGMAALFAASLAWPPVMVERIARLADPGLPAAARPYLRRVTQAWVVFLLGNAAIAGWTVLYGSLEQWAFYNGFLSYLLMAGMFAGEWLLRPKYPA